jgi:transcription termination factor NusB
MVVESTVQPIEISIDKVGGGRVRLLCRWDIKQITRVDESGEQIIWQYEEAALWWTIPYLSGETVLDTIESIDAYIASNTEEILNFAKGTKIVIKDAAVHVAAMYEARAKSAEAVVIKEAVEVSDTAGKQSTIEVSLAIDQKISE